MKIELSSSFIKSYKKISVKRPDIAVLALEKILLFSQEPNHPSLRYHKLKGHLKDFYSFSIEQDVRVIVDMQTSGTGLLIVIGSHDEVY